MEIKNQHLLQLLKDWLRFFFELKIFVYGDVLLMGKGIMGVIVYYALDGGIL